MLSHLFWEQVEQVARQVEGVNAILGSHHGPQPSGYLDQPRVVGTTILSKPGHDMAPSASSTSSCAAATAGSSATASSAT